MYFTLHVLSKGTLISPHQSLNVPNIATIVKDIEPHARTFFLLFSVACSYKCSKSDSPDCLNYTNHVQLIM